MLSVRERKQKLGIGSAQFGSVYGISNSTGQTSAKEVTAILDAARDNDIDIIDTASAYGSEKVIGQNDLSAFKVVSKFMPPEDQTIFDQLRQSIADLGIPSLYGYLAHRPNHLADNLHQWNELKSFKEDELVKKIGFSLYWPEELEDLLQKNIIPDLIQVPFNYFDRRFKNQMIDLKKQGCEIHVRSVFLQGLFFMDIRNLDDYFEEVILLIEQLQKTTDNLPGALLNFVLNQPFVDSVVVGVENRKQFLQNLESVCNFESLPDLEQDISNSIIIPSNWPK